jgi:hypothetical protein
VVPNFSPLRNWIQPRSPPFLVAGVSFALFEWWQGYMWQGYIKSSSRSVVFSKAKLHFWTWTRFFLRVTNRLSTNFADRHSPVLALFFTNDTIYPDQRVMLKISYSDTNIAIEQLTITPEALVAQRSVFALRVGQSIFVQVGRGSLLLPAEMPGVSAFLRISESSANLTVAPCDCAWLEVTLQGIWIATTATHEQGILAVELGNEREHQLAHLWRRSLSWAPAENPLPKAC